MKGLVTGGAGCVGGQAVLALLDRGFSPIILDDLSAGASPLVPKKVPLVGDIGDQELVADIIANNEVDTILHFARTTRAITIPNPADASQHGPGAR